MARPGTSRSTGPSPATVRTVQPRSPKTARPRRGDDRHAVVTTQPERDEGDGGHARHATHGLGARPPTRAGSSRRAWRADGAGGFCVPHATTYPWQWLWDSCFHAVVWAHLGDDRAAAELRSALSAPGRRRLRAPPALRRPAPRRTALCGARRRRRRSPSRRCTATPSPSSPGTGCAVDDERRRPGRARAALPACTGGDGRRPGSSSSATRGSRGATTARAGTTPCPGAWTPPALVRSQGRAGGRHRAHAGGRTGAQPGLRRGLGRLLAPSWRGTRASWRRSRARPTSRRAAAELAGRIDARWDEDRRTWVDDGPSAHRIGRGPHRSTALLPAPGRARAARVRASSSTPRPSARRSGPGRPPGRADLRAGDLLARPGLAAAHLPAVAGGDELGRSDAAAVAVEVDGGGCGGVGVRRVLGGRHRSSARRRPPDLERAAAMVVERVARPPARRRAASSQTASAAPTTIREIAEGHDLAGHAQRQDVAQHRERDRRRAPGGEGRRASPSRARRRSPPRLARARCPARASRR